MRLDMHDYTAEARAYWWVVTGLGALVLASSLGSMAREPPHVLLELAFGAVFAALAGMFPVRLPGSKTSCGAAELVLFLLLLQLGPAAATIGAAVEAGAISWRTSTRWTSRLGSPAIAALAMNACGTAFSLAQAHVPATIALGAQARHVLLLVFAVLYFVTNTLLMASLIKLKRREPLRPLATLREHAWLGLVYVASASVAVLLRAGLAEIGVSVLLAAVPLIAVFASVLHMYFRRAEEREQLRADRLADAERAAAESARHLEELRASDDRFQSAFTHAAVGMVLVTMTGQILQANPALARLLGRDVEGLADALLDDIFDPEAVKALHAEVRSLADGEEDAFVTELRCRHASGVEVWASVSGSLFAARAPLSHCVILQLQDITARRRAEARLHYIATRDGLTGLLNRDCFMEELGKAVAATARHPERRFAVLFLDFDRFKLVNDSLGHGAGDALLQSVARRIAAHLRPADLLARFGGDEFAVLLRDALADREAVPLAERLQRLIAEPIQVNGVPISTSASIGITTSAFGYDSSEQVMRDADAAMYRAKERGRAQHAIFDSVLHAEVSNRLWLEGELRRAVRCGELGLAYQPIFDCATRTLIGFEALARWKHPQCGNVAADTFIRIAEETGLIVALGEWALRAACQTLARWRDEHAACTRLAMHVNVSGLQLAQPDFPALVRRALEATGVDAGQVVIEVTESILIEQRSFAIPHLHELRELGVGISIDDFGTGYSSFSVLHTLPIDEIKIDRSFISALGVSAQGEAVVATMLSLCRTLGKDVVAEGVETELQLARLVEMGCSKGQGYLLGHPLGAEAAAALVAQSVSRPPSVRLPIEMRETRPQGVTGGDGARPVGGLPGQDAVHAVDAAAPRRSAL